uniref:pyridoxal kinase n=1 Tax=Herpetomonas muscarum TaxID=5718 RepID=T1YS53_HERMU|nr:pyridoxal kinase [Herpetomonas muscarum]
MSYTSKNILSIQSHVAHGYVGNVAATFPLQLHGFDVDAVNTVSLSNHSGYPTVTGHRMDIAEYESILAGLRANGFLSTYDTVLTGYINNKDIVAAVRATVAEIRRLRAEAGRTPVRFFCDPVMGDDGKLYCSDVVIAAYRELLGVADIATPNYFEASVLSGVEVVDLDSAQRACDWFHQQGTACVIIKSFKIPGDDGNLHFLLSVAEREQTAEGNGPLVLPPRRFTGTVPFYNCRYTGTGDVFAASLVAFSHDNPIEVAVGKAMGVLQDLIRTTWEENGNASSDQVALCELRIVKHPESLKNPKTVVEVKQM